MTVLDESPRDLSASGINLSMQRVAATCKDRPVIVALLAGDICHLAFTVPGIEPVHQQGKISTPVVKPRWIRSTRGHPTCSAW